MKGRLFTPLAALFGLTDEQAMWRVQMEADPQAFALLVRRWEAPIQRLCARMTGDPNQGEDLAQETFARLYGQRRNYRAEGKFPGFLRRIALNLCYDALRRRQRRRETALEEPGPDHLGPVERADSTTPSPAEATEESERARQVREALLALPEAYQSVIVLRHYEGLKFREIAEALEIPEGTVKSRMAEGLTQLHRLLSPEFNPGGPRPGNQREVILLMKHPTQEQWMEYLYGEAPEGRRSEMARHLPDCQPCRLRLAGWRVAKGALDQWPLETRSARRPFLHRRAVWALAACLTLFVGVGLGRLTAARAYDPRQVADLLEPKLRLEIKNTTREEAGRWELSARQGLAAAVRREMEAELDKKLETAAARGGLEAERVMTRVAESLASLRETDRTEVLALIKQIQTDEAARLASIRQDLETVAIVGEAKIQDTQRELGELAGVSQTFFHPKTEKP